MNFRFPRYVSDVSILRAYVGPDGSHREYHEDNVPWKPTHYLRVGLDGVKDGDFTWIGGFPGNINRYRMSFLASDWSYNEKTGRSIAIDVRFALFVAREVHGAGWIVDELTK
jgi:hypothetical protein